MDWIGSMLSGSRGLILVTLFWARQYIPREGLFEYGGLWNKEEMVVTYEIPPAKRHHTPQEGWRSIFVLLVVQFVSQSFPE